MMKKSIGKIFLDGIYLKNPVLGMFLGLTIAVLATTYLQNAIVISIIVGVTLIICELVISLLRNKIDHFVASLVAVLIAAAITTVSSLLLSAYYPSIGLENYSDYSNLIVTGIVPFAAVSSLYLTKGKEALEYKPSEALADSLGSTIGFALALSLIAVVREILATGELCFSYPDGVQAYVHLWDLTMPIFGQPFGGLLFTGLFSGFHNCIVNGVNNRRMLRLQKGI